MITLFVYKFHKNGCGIFVFMLTPNVFLNNILSKQYNDKLYVFFIQFNVERKYGAFWLGANNYTRESFWTHTEASTCVYGNVSDGV